MLCWHSISNVNLFKVIVYFLYFRFLLYVSTGKFFKKYHTHQRRTVHPLSPLSRTIPHIFHPTTDMERCHRRVAVLYSQRVRAAAHRMGIVSTLSRKTSPKKIFLWGFVFLLSFAITFVPFIWLYPDEFWEVNPFSTQSSLVSFHFIVLFVLIAIAGSFFCRNYNDVRFSAFCCYSVS